MRERERLEDFKGGHVACRGCRRLLYFAPESIATARPVICCGIAYVPTQHQTDLMIYDKLQPGEMPWAVTMPTPGPVEIAILEPAGDEDDFSRLDLSIRPETEAALEELVNAPPFEPSPTEEAELALMEATPAQVAERRAERMAQIKKRGGINYG